MKSMIQVRHVDVVSSSSASKEKSRPQPASKGSKPQMLMAPSSSLSTLQAKKARTMAHKQLLKNVSVLAAQKVKVERLLHECLKGASALQIATEKANAVITMLRSSKDSYDTQIVQFSLLPSYVHSSPTREHQKLCEQAHFDDASMKQPFTMHKTKLELYRRRREVAESPTSRGASINSAKNVLIDALTASDAAAVMEHSAMVEILSDDLSNFIASEGSQCREELSQMKLRLQAMKNLIHCATDAEVQVLQNTFPFADHVRSVEEDYEHTPMKRGDGLLAAAADEKLLFVNASPIFPNMTLADFPTIASECDHFTGRAKRVTAALHKSTVEYRERCNRSEQNVRCALERGKRLADTKRLSSEIHLKATEAEELQLRQKKSELLQCVANLSSRLECVEGSLRMREALYSGVGSYSVSSPKGQRPVTAMSELLVVLSGERSKSQSASPGGHYESVGFGPVIRRADSPTVQRSPTNALPTAECEDVVFVALMEEKRQLLLRTAELGEKINHIGNQLWKISMEKKRYRHDMKQADWRGAACGAVASSPTSAERQRQNTE